MSVSIICQSLLLSMTIVLIVLTASLWYLFGQSRAMERCLETHSTDTCYTQLNR